MGLVLATPAGMVIDCIGARRCGIAVAVISASAIAAMSAVGDSLWHWWAAWALFGVAGAFTSTVWLAPVSTIFYAGRGLAIAVTISGTGISMAIAPAIAEYFVQNHSWRSGFLAVAGLWFVLTMPLVMAFVPGLPGSSEDVGADDTTPQPRELTGLTPREGFVCPALYLLFFASLLSSMTGVALILNLCPC